MSNLPKHIFLSDWRNPKIQLDSGKGIYFYDKDGREYLDAASGAVNVSLGYGREDMADAIRDQSVKFSYLTRYTGIPQILKDASDVLHEQTGYDRFFMVSGGSEAVEMAARIAKAHWLHKGKPLKNKVMSRWMSYHGGTFLTMSFGGNISRKGDMGSSMIDEGHIAPPNCYRCWFDKEPETCNVECALALQTELDQRGSEHYAAFLMEPVSGTSMGSVTPPQKYFDEIRRICDENDLLLIVDEVMCGYGRIGTWTAMEYFNDVKADIICMAKGLSGGYYPVGAVGTTEAVAEPFKEFGSYNAGFTFAGNPTACRVLLEVTKIMKDEKLVENSAKMGAFIKSEMERFAETSRIIGDVRGPGLMTGFEFVKDKDTKESFEKSDMCLATVLQESYKLGIIPEPVNNINGGTKGEGLMLTPYYGITKDEATKMIDLQTRAITAAEKKLFK